MSKYDIPPQFEYQNTMFGQILNVKIGFQMSKYDNWPDFECQNRILNEKYEIWPQFECQNRILNVKIRFSAQL